jgi:hypothetical protein
MKKLLYGIGTDPSFVDPHVGSARINVTPKNMNRICDRFGLVCDESQASEIFDAHGLNKRGVNIYEFTAKLLHTDSDGLARRQQRVQPDYSRQVRETARAVRAANAPFAVDDRFKLARMPQQLWSEHASSNSAASPQPAAGKPTGAHLPPINPIC